MNQSQGINTLPLGRLVREYKGSTAHVVKLVVVSSISAVIAAPFLAGALTSPDWTGRIGFSIPGLLFLLPVAVGIYMLGRGRGASLSLYEHGCTYQRGRNQWATTWDEIDSYIQGTACRLTKKNGEVIEFGTNILHADEVALRIQEETLNRLLPRMIAGIHRGSSIHFAGLKPGAGIPLGRVIDQYALASSGFTVDANGIADTETGDRIAWKDVTRYGIAEEEVGSGRGLRRLEVFLVQSRDKSLSARLGLLSNAHVLLALCSELTGRAPE
jgi:Family of unknown function (DUF6585)